MPRRRGSNGKPRATTTRAGSPTEHPQPPLLTSIPKCSQVLTSTHRYKYSRVAPPRAQRRYPHTASTRTSGTTQHSQEITSTHKWSRPRAQKQVTDNHATQRPTLGTSHKYSQVFTSTHKRCPQGRREETHNRRQTHPNRVRHSENMLAGPPRNFFKSID